MVLGEALEDAAGVTHAMLGLLGHSTSFAKRKMNLGYREARLLADCPLGRAGRVIRGHEFHYARLTATGNDEPLAELADGQGKPLGTSGGRRGHVTGTFFHAIARGDEADGPSRRQIVDDIALCLVFFTRLPLPVFDFRGRSLPPRSGPHRSPASSSA